MALVKSYLKQVISGDSTFCNFCFNNIQENSSFFNDEVTIENNITLKITDMIITVIGAKHVDLCSSKTLCQQCTNNLINTYKFIKMCKDNTEQVYNAIQSLENGLSGCIGDTACQSLFITLNTKTYTSKLLYDSETSKNISTALQRLQILNDMQNSSKADVLRHEWSVEFSPSDTCCNASNKKAKKLRRCKKSNKIKKVPINEIIHDVSNMSNFKCKVCLNSYSNFYRLKLHFQRVHAPKEFNCSECTRSYGSAALLTQHKYDSHSSLICSDCGKSYSNRSTFKSHMQGHILKLVCQICGKVFKNKRNFNNHMKLNICDLSVRRMSLDKKFVCDYCNKRYSGKSTLRAHITFEHGNGAVHVCSWCNKKFNAVSRLNAHIVTHTQEKKYSCDVCSGVFVTKESLRYHTRIHTGERPYQCDYCEQRFLSTSRRAEHVRRHHRDPTVDCDICHSKFRSRSCLTRHKNRHFNPNSRLHYTRIVPEDKEM